VGGRVNFGTRLSKIWVYYNDSSYFTYRLTYRGGRGFGLCNRSVYILCKKNTCTYIYILICILYQYIREMIRAREHVQKRRPRRRKRNSVVARATTAVNVLGRARRKCEDAILLYFSLRIFFFFLSLFTLTSSSLNLNLNLQRHSRSFYYLSYYYMYSCSGVVVMVR